MKDTALDWIEALPLVLMSFRFSVNRTAGFTPFELQHGRPFPRPWGKVGPIASCMSKSLYLQAPESAETGSEQRRDAAVEGLQKEVAGTTVDRTVPSDRPKTNRHPTREERKELVPPFPVHQGSIVETTKGFCDVRNPARRNR